MTDCWIEAHQLTRRFGDRTALDAVSVRIARGDQVALTGPSGGGKTTLLSLLGLIDRPSGGRIEWEGRDLARLSQTERARTRRRIGLVFQQTHMITRLSVWENITYPLLPLGVGATARRTIALRWLARLGLEDRAESRPEELSGGERRRVGVARALAADPELILADEPMSDLDPESARLVSSLFEEFHGGGGTIVLATHAPDEDARSARLLRLESGRLVH